jgi:hypothetical protein
MRLAHHSTHQILLAISFGQELHGDRGYLADSSAMNSLGVLVILQWELARRVTLGLVGQDLPEKLGDYDS